MTQQDERPAERRRHGELTPGRVAVNTITVLAVLGTAVLLVQVKEILVLFLIGILLASAIEPIVERLHARGLDRGQAVGIVYVVGCLLLGALLALLIPTVVQEVARFSASAPNLLRDLRESALASQHGFIRENGPHFVDQLGERLSRFELPTEQAITLATALPSVLGSLLAGVIAIVTTLMVTFFWITEKRIIKRVFLSYFVSEERRERARAIWNEIESKLGGYIRGQLILMGIVGVVAVAGYAVMGLRFAVLLGVITGLFAIIPFIGPWFSGVPAVLIALTQSWQLAVAVIIFTIVIQMIGGNVLIPRVMKGSVGLSPLLVVLAILIGVRTLGPVGAIIAIPLAAALQVLIGELLRSHQEAVAAESVGAAVANVQVFHWRPGRLPSRLQGVQPGPAVVSPVVELPTPPADTAAVSQADSRVAGSSGSD